MNEKLEKNTMEDSSAEDTGNKVHEEMEGTVCGSAGSADDLEIGEDITEEGAVQMSEVQFLKNQIENLEEITNELKAKVIQEEKTIAKLEDDVIIRDNEIESLKKELKSNKGRVTSLKNQVKSQFNPGNSKVVDHG